MRVLELVDGIDGGGAGKIVYDYVSHMNKDDIEIDVLSFYKSDHSKPFLHDAFMKAGCNINYIDNRNKGLKKHFKEYKKVIKQGQYDIIHCHAGDWSFPYLYYAKKMGIPVRIAHSHITKSEYKGFKKIIVSFFRSMLPSVATNRYACGIEAGKHLWGKKSFTVMNNAVDCGLFKFDKETRNRIRHELQISDNTIVLLHIARFCYQKNNEFVVDIATELKKKKIDFKVLCVGVGKNFEKVQAEVSKRGLTDCYNFLGMRNDVSEILMGSDIAVLPSRFEGLPIFSIEAQASGIPLLMSDKISSEAKILDSTAFLDIDNGCQEWVDKINEITSKSSSIDRFSGYLAVKDAGFDIVDQSQKLRTDYYLYLRESEKCK